MKVVFHPGVAEDQRAFEANYGEISDGLAQRFRTEVDQAIEAMKVAPSGAGHFLSTGSMIVPEFRRRNLRSFPFFVLYGWTGELVIFGSLIPTRTDPLQWLKRFSETT